MLLQLGRAGVFQGRTVAARSSPQPAAQPRGCLASVPVERFAWQQSKPKKTCNSSVCLSLQHPAGCCQDIAGTIGQPHVALGWPSPIHPGRQNLSFFFQSQLCSRLKYQVHYKVWTWAADLSKNQTAHCSQLFEISLVNLDKEDICFSYLVKAYSQRKSLILSNWCGVMVFHWTLTYLTWACSFSTLKQERKVIAVQINVYVCVSCFNNSSPGM